MHVVRPNQIQRISKHYIMQQYRIHKIPPIATLTTITEYACLALNGTHLPSSTQVTHAIPHPPLQCAGSAQECINVIRCNKELKICEGVSLNGPCRISADCNVGLFCNFWHCTRLLRQGEKCTSHDQCGRDSLCYIKNIGDVAGICTNLFTYDDEYQLLPLGLDDKPGMQIISVFLWR
jgi:hypothetical protein